jgi:hypothetical protein
MNKANEPNVKRFGPISARSARFPGSTPAALCHKRPPWRNSSARIRAGLDTDSDRPLNVLLAFEDGDGKLTEVIALDDDRM